MVLIDKVGEERGDDERVGGDAWALIETLLTPYEKMRYIHSFPHRSDAHTGDKAGWIYSRQVNRQV